MLYVLGGLCCAVAAFLIAVLLDRKFRQWSRTAALRVRSANGIVEEAFVPIEGIEQWIGIRGEDRNNPVLLLIHGGPGASLSIFTPLIQPWEQHFTIVQWDQRGSGKTLRRTGKKGTGELTLDQLTRDGIAVAEYIRTRLRKDKVILMVCSYGSTFGLSMARRRPDLFAACVGTDLNVGMARDRRANHDEVVKRLRANGMSQGVAALEKIGPDPSSWTAEDFMALSKWTMKSDPATCRRIMNLLKKSIWYSPAHSLLEIQVFITGMNFSLSRLFPDFSVYDAWRSGTRYEIPFFVFQGESDTLTLTREAQAYFDDVVAPVKEMRLIRDAGHFAAFIQPEQFLSELLVNVRPLAVKA